MAASSKLGSPRARAPNAKGQCTRTSQKSNSSTPSPAPSDTSSLKAVYQTPASSSNNGASSDEERPGPSNGKSGVLEGKKLQIPEDPGVRSTGTNDLLQWLKDATAESDINRVWESMFQSYIGKLSEEIRMRCQAEDQLKLVNVTREKEEALREALEEQLKRSQDELKKLQETQDAQAVLLSEYQGECSNKDVQEQGRPPKDTGDVLNEREVYLKNMWNEAAEQREVAMDQAAVYERDNNVVMQKNDQLEIEKAELAERLERSKSNAFTQKLDLERVEKESKCHERENINLKQENAELMKQLEVYKSKSVKEQASQRDAVTQTELGIETIVTSTEGTLDTFPDLTTGTIGGAVTRENDEVLDEVQVYEEEDQEDHPEEADEPHERLVATDNDVASDGDAEPDKTEQQDTNEQQNTNIPSAEEDRTVVRSPVHMILAVQQDVAPAETVPEPSIVAPIPSSHRRRGNKVSKTHRHKHRPKEDLESRQQKGARHLHRSDNNKKRHTPTSETRQIKKKERVPLRRAWVRCLKHPARVLSIYFNLNIFSRQCMNRYHR
ncbi:hypothetical protein SNK03_006609 [Fusarium graminearum]